MNGIKTGHLSHTYHLKATGECSQPTSTQQSERQTRTVIHGCHRYSKLRAVLIEYLCSHVYTKLADYILYIHGDK